jgi:predicted nucleic acid-binding protein
VIFVDTNVFMYAVGKEHPLRERARRFFYESMESTDVPRATSAEVLQELLHAYLPVGRFEAFDAALDLIQTTVAVVWPVEAEDVLLARMLASRHPALGARDLLHLACCRRRSVTAIQTFDRGLAAAFSKK